MAQRGRLAFDCYESKCGTYKCLAGWSQQFFPSLRITSGPGYPVSLDSVRDAFGMAGGEWSPVFGLPYNGTLSDRETYVRNVLRPRWQSRLNELLGTPS